MDSVQQGLLRFTPEKSLLAARVLNCNSKSDLLGSLVYGTHQRRNLFFSSWWLGILCLPDSAMFTPQENDCLRWNRFFSSYYVFHLTRVLKQTLLVKLWRKTNFLPSCWSWVLCFAKWFKVAEIYEQSGYMETAVLPQSPYLHEMTTFTPSHLWQSQSFFWGDEQHWYLGTKWLLTESI